MELAAFLQSRTPNWGLLPKEGCVCKGRHDARILFQPSTRVGPIFFRVDPCVDGWVIRASRSFPPSLGVAVCIKIALRVVWVQLPMHTAMTSELPPMPLERPDEHSSCLGVGRDGDERKQWAAGLARRGAGRRKPPGTAPQMYPDRRTAGPHGATSFELMFQRNVPLSTMTSVRSDGQFR